MATPQKTPTLRTMSSTRPRQLCLEETLAHAKVGLLADRIERLETLVYHETLVNELLSATQWASQLLADDIEPIGRRCSTRAPYEVKEGIRGNAECLFGATLGMLNLNVRASKAEVDVGRMRWVMENCRSAEDAGPFLTSLVVDARHFAGQELRDLHRLTHDAEVDTICLLLYWHRDDADVMAALRATLKDVAFSMEDWGEGCKAKVEEFRRDEVEEAKRDVLGKSAWRKCRKLVDISDTARQEGATGVTDADSVANLLKRLGGDIASSWNKETVARYLIVGRRMSDPRLTQLMQRWEFMYKRQTLVDGISVLRACTSVATTDEDLYYLMQTLYYEQTCKIRHSLKANHPTMGATAVMRGIMYRRQFYSLMARKFPKHADWVRDYGTPAWYENACAKRNDAPAEDSGSDDGAEERTLHQPHLEDPVTEATSQHLSRPALREFLDRVARNAYESAFIAMGKQGGGLHLLGTGPGAGLRARLDDIQAHYDQDFPVMTEPPAEALSGVRHPDGSLPPGTSDVKMDDAITSEEEYQSLLREYVEQCKSVEEREIRNYVTTRVAIVVGNIEEDVEQLKKALAKIPLLREEGRRLFLYDLLVSKPLDWEKIRCHKRSYLNRTPAIKMTYGNNQGDDSLALLKELYMTFRGQDETDVCAVVVPGSSTDVPANPGLVNVCKSLSALQPKHVGPKIGALVINQSDLIRQVQARSVWRRRQEDKLVFTYQRRRTCTCGRG